MGASEIGLWLGILGVAFGLALALCSVLFSRQYAARLRHEADLLDQARLEADRQRDRAESQAAQFRKALDAMTDGIMMLDADQRLLEWNARFAPLIGVPHHVLTVGTPMADILRAQAEAGEFGPLDGPEAIEAAVQVRMANLVDFHGPAFAERLRPNGRSIETRRTTMPGGGFITLYSDITQRRQAEAAERAAVAAAAAAVRQRQEFVAMMTHELRSPLSAIADALALVDETGLPEQARKQIACARLQAGRMQELTADILDMARLDEGRVVLREADFSMAELLGEVCASFRDAASAAGKILLSVADTGVPAMQWGDSGRVRQVLTNLVSNAVKYAGPGVVTLRATVVNTMLRLSVKDSGPVIPPGQASTLFQPFARLRSAELGGQSGSGLGLAIRARLVALLGGEIGLAREDTGNAFWFTLPIVPARGPCAVEPSHAAARPAQRANILLVEDLAPTRDLTAIMLRREGHRVEVTGDGLSAVDMAAQRIYDVVLMDIHLPGIDGITAAGRIRALPGPQGRAAIIALTGALSPSQEQAAAAVMDAILSKPARPEMVLATIERLMGGKEMDAGIGMSASPVVGDLDTSRIATLREGLPPGMFTRLLNQCVVEIKQRLPALMAADADADTLREAAHALAGMAGSYGLAAFEREMRAVIRAAEAGLIAEAHRIAASADTLLARAEAAMLAET